MKLFKKELAFQNSQGLVMSQILYVCMLFIMSPLFADKIGLLVMATGKYTVFIEPLVRTARTHFCKNHEVTFFVFTDGQIPTDSDIVPLYQSRLGWPFDTMMRFHTYAKHADLLLTQDYLFACDADMLFVDSVGDEILSDRVATLHPGFVGHRGSYETNQRSLAYVKPTEGSYYFAGGFYGGKSHEVIKICRTLAERIDRDASRNVIAVWHDESHWNRYCIDYPPTLILSPSYCYQENSNLNYQKRLLALDKNHNEIRFGN